MNTKQQEFDAVVNHLYAQGRPAREGHRCKYRSDEGLMCAVGCRIPDSVYVEGMEGNHIFGLIEYPTLHGAALPSEIGEYCNMCRELQRIHDDWQGNREGIYKFSSIVKGLMLLADEEGITFNDPRTA